MKVCSKCGIKKDENEFPPHINKNPNMKAPRCIYCINEYNKIYKKTEKAKQTTKKYINRNKEKILEYNRNYYNCDPSKNPHLIKEENIKLLENGLHRCSCCKKKLNVTEFHRDLKKPTKLSAYCKRCKKEKYEKTHIYKRYNKTNSEVISLKNKGLKVCTKCKKTLPENSFYKNYCSCIECSENRISRIKYKLKFAGVDTILIPPELIELKKLQLQIKREIKKGVQNEKTN